MLPDGGFAPAHRPGNRLGVGIAEVREQAPDDHRHEGDAEQDGVADLIADAALVAGRDRSDTVTTAGVAPDDGRADGGGGDTEVELEAGWNHAALTS